MKLVLGLSLLWIAALPARGEAQVLCTLGAPATPYDSMADMPASAGAQADLKKVKSAMCQKSCGKVLLFANPTSPNAVTVTDGNGVSKISYSPKFLASVQEKYGPAATLGIFAHELGHHVDAAANRAPWMKASWDGEQRADAWAGCALAKTELKPSALQAAVRALSVYPAPGHAAWSERATVLRAGYTSCGGSRTLPGALEEASDQVSASGDGTASSGAPGGCTSDHDCRNGRSCSNGRCKIATGPKRCGKDTDCPEPQECNPSGRCEGPGSTEAQGETPRESVPAVLQERHPAPAQPTPAAAKDPPESAVSPAKEVAVNEPAPKSPKSDSNRSDSAACVKTCDDGRNRCMETAIRELNQCVAAVQSESSYKACSCPSYPEGNYACYRLCSKAYEEAKTCSTPDKVRDCKLEGERCRTRCR